MWTLDELKRIDAAVRKRYSLPRAHNQEQVGLSLKQPVDDDGATYRHVRLLTYELCGMHYTSPQFNLCLLQDHINQLAGLELVKEIPTYSAPRFQINFLTDKGRVSFDPSEPIDKHHFLSSFGLV